MARPSAGAAERAPVHGAFCARPLVGGVPAADDVFPSENRFPVAAVTLLRRRKRPGHVWKKTTKKWA